MEQSQRDLVIETPDRLHRNRVQTAQALGISRATLYRKMRTLNIVGADELTQ